MARLLLTAVWALLALVAPAAEPYVPQQAVDLFDGREGSAPEGVWRVTDGAVFAVVRTGDAVDRYDLVMVSSPDLRLPGFTRVGWMKAADLAGSIYEAEMYTDVDASGRLGGKHRYKVRFSTKAGEEVLGISPVRTFKLRLSTAFNFLIRAGVEAQSHDVKISAIRVWPASAASALNPEVL